MVTLDIARRSITAASAAAQALVGGAHHRPVGAHDPRADLPHPDAKADARWRAVLEGDPTHSPGLARLRRIFRHLPSDPRCKLCYAPYAPPFGPILGALGFGKWPKNPALCGSCLRIMERAQGGAEIDLSMLFADVRGSTELAAGMSPRDYHRLLNGFYRVATHAVEDRNGSIDKYLGDGIFALFIPGFTGPEHAARAIDAGRAILTSAVSAAQTRESGIALPIGIGIHTGPAYVGVVGGGGDLSDFTALGDAVNITERLSSTAIAGELLVSDAALSLSGYPSTGLTRRDLALKGVPHHVTTWSQLVSGGAAPSPTGSA